MRMMMDENAHPHGMEVSLFSSWPFLPLFLSLWRKYGAKAVFEDHCTPVKWMGEQSSWKTKNWLVWVSRMRVQGGGEVTVNLFWCRCWSWPQGVASQSHDDFWQITGWPENNNAMTEWTICLYSASLLTYMCVYVCTWLGHLMLLFLFHFSSWWLLITHL